MQRDKFLHTRGLYSKGRRSALSRPHALKHLSDRDRLQSLAIGAPCPGTFRLNVQRLTFEYVLYNLPGDVLISQSCPGDIAAGFCEL